MCVEKYEEGVESVGGEVGIKRDGLRRPYRYPPRCPVLTSTIASMCTNTSFTHYSDIVAKQSRLFRLRIFATAPCMA